MPTCVPATDAALIAAWPGVVLRTPERWLVAIDADLAATGQYVVSLSGLPYASYAATVPPDDGPGIAEQVLALLQGQMLAAASPVGATGIVLQEVSAAAPGLAVTVSGPVPGAITAILVSGGDSNAARRAQVLVDALCDLPPCCTFGRCVGDYTRMHAAMAAHLLYQSLPGNVGGTGASVGDFRRMRLGPAELERGSSESGAKSTANDDLRSTAPGKEYLRLRKKYVMPFNCA